MATWICGPEEEIELVLPRHGMGKPRLQLVEPEHAEGTLRRGLPDLWRTVPIDPGEPCPLPPGLRQEAQWPRDGERLASTCDLLFLGRLRLAAAAAGAQWVVALRGGRGAAWQAVYLEDRDGAALSPLSGTPVDGVALPPDALRLRPGRVLRHPLRGFLELRGLVLDPQGRTVVLDGEPLALEGAPLAPALAALDRRLRWPLHGEDTGAASLAVLDRLAAGLGRLGGWGEATSFDALCPFDGPVPLSLAEVISPAWTWDHLVGRHFLHAVCPRCLGVFATLLVAMS